MVEVIAGVDHARTGCTAEVADCSEKQTVEFGLAGSDVRVCRNITCLSRTTRRSGQYWKKQDGRSDTGDCSGNLDYTKNLRVAKTSVLDFAEWVSAVGVCLLQARMILHQVCMLQKSKADQQEAKVAWTYRRSMLSDHMREALCSY